MDALMCNRAIREIPKQFRTAMRVYVQTWILDHDGVGGTYGERGEKLDEAADELLSVIMKACELGSCMVMASSPTEPLDRDRACPACSAGATMRPDGRYRCDECGHRFWPEHKEPGAS